MSVRGAGGAVLGCVLGASALLPGCSGNGAVSGAANARRASAPTSMAAPGTPETSPSSAPATAPPSEASTTVAPTITIPPAPPTSPAPVAAPRVVPPVVALRSTTTVVVPLRPPPSAVPGANGRVTAVGDSVMIDAAPALRVDIPGIDVNAAVSRQWSSGS